MAGPGFDSDGRPGFDWFPSHWVTEAALGWNMRAAVAVPLVRPKAGVDDADKLARRLVQCLAVANTATAVVGVGVREIIGRVRLRREASTNHLEQRDPPRSIAASSPVGGEN